MKPKRIQRKRTKGWKMPANTVSVTRPGKWGNPFIVGERDLVTGNVFDAALAVQRFRQQIGILGPFYRASIVKALHGKNLACFCPLYQPCHADVLLEIANSEESP